MNFRTADLMDSHSEELSCETQFRMFGRRRTFHGSLRTLRVFEDNLLIKQVLSTISQGEILVVDGGGSLRTALIGDHIARIAMENGWAGVIIHGAVRDSLALEDLEFGVKALGTNPRRSGKAGDGTIDSPVSFGGVTFITRHYLYSDEDGIVVAPQPLHH